MKPTELKQQYVLLRADGRSYDYIAKELHISKSTCFNWEKELGEQIAQLKKEMLNGLYDTYGMKKESRIKQLGETLNKVDEALEAADFNEVAPEKLLDFKLKYTEALQKEYISPEPAFKLQDNINAKDIVAAFGDLLNRVKAGEVTTEQASKESLILSNLLKAYETVEVKAKLDVIEATLERRS